jgi:hypothetical protein
VFGQLLGLVVDDVVGAEGTNEVELLCAGDAGDEGAVRLRDLDGVGADTAARTDQQYLLPGLHLPVVAYLKTQEGYEWLYVLWGRMRVVIADHDVVLAPGGVAEFDTRVPHWFGFTGDQPVEVVSLFGPHGQRMH